MPPATVKADMHIPIRRVVQVMASTAALAAAVGGCTRAVDGRAEYATEAPAATTRLVKIADLPSLLPTLSETSAVIDSPQFANVATDAGLKVLPEGFTLSDRNCVSVMNGGLESQYRGSHYQGASGLTIKVDQDRLVETVAVAFPGSVDADKFVGTQIGKWKGCAGATLTVNYADQPPVTWTVSGPKRSYGVAVVIRVQEGGRGFGCARAIAARANVVVDLSVCNPDQELAELQASKLINISLRKIRE